MEDEKKVSLIKKEAAPGSEQTTEVTSQQKPLQSTSENEQDVPKKTSWVQIRVIPIYVRVILVILLLTVVAIIGLRIGYGSIGDGEPGDVLKKETWMHIVDIIKGKE